MSASSELHQSATNVTVPDRRSGEADIDVRLLGSLVVSAGAQTVPLGGARTRKLLALLAVNANSVVPSVRMVETLWDDPPSSAGQQVYNVVGDLRRRLETGGRGLEIITCSTGYQLRLPASAVDALRFWAATKEADRAERRGHLAEAVSSLNLALRQWRGPAFSGLSSQHLQNIATTLNEERLAVVEHLAELQLRQGDSPIRELLEVVSEHPFRESLRALLMKALYRSGRQVDALAVFEEGRRRLADELGLDPGPQLLAAQQLVLAGNAEGEVSDSELSTRGGSPWRAELGPNFLPRDIAEFTGRDDEVRQLIAGARYARTTALIISAIDGMGGVGKTTLAVHLAHKLAEYYPDGQYFIDLLGFSAGNEPLPPLQALSMLLQNSGTPPELIPPELEARSALWRSSVAGRRIILLLDNAADAAQVRPLLPGAPGTLVLISSRRQMTSLEGAVPLALDVMSPEDAMFLFQQIVGLDRTSAEQEAASEAVELCGRLPLAIQVAAARLRDRPSWSVNYLAEQLRDQRSRARILAVGDRDVMGILGWSYRHLSACQRTLFRLLGLHPGPDFDAHAAAALAGLPLDAAAICLEELLEVNLLQQRAAGRYRFHDLVGDCAQHLLREHRDDAEQVSARQRLLDYYLRSANQWCSVEEPAAFRFDLNVVYQPTAVHRPETSAAAVKRLDTEYRNLVAAVQLASGTGDQARTWQLTCSLLPYFAHLNYGPEAETLLQQALRCARADGSVRGESASLMGLAQCRSVQGLNAEARDLAIQAVALSQQHGDQAMEVSQRTSLGVMYWRNNCVDDALACYTSSLALAREIHNLPAEASLTNNLGVLYEEMGHLDEALKHYRRAVSIAAPAAAGTSAGAAQVTALGNTGRILSLLRDHSGAAAQINEALRLCRSAGNRRGEAAALIGLCSVRRLLGDHAGSLQYGREALEMARGLTLYDLEADALNALEDTYLALGDVKTAEQISDQADKIAAMYKSARYTARSHEGRAHIRSAKGDLETARNDWKQALAIYPGGVVDMTGARRHLASPGYGTEFCWRCDPGGLSETL